MKMPFRRPVSLSRRARILGSIALSAVLFVSINGLAGNTLGNWRIDATEAKVWSLSQGTRSLLSDLAEPLHLRLYLSSGLTQAAPQLSAYAARVRGVLEDYADRSNGMLTLEVIDPAPYSDAEDRAVGLGVNRITLPGLAEPLFFGLAATNSTDGRATIPIFSPEREAWLEYDLTRLIARLAQTKRPKLALIDGIGLQGNPMMGQPEAQSLALLRELYDVEVLTGDVQAFPEGTKAVAVVHPQELTQPTLYALDQWALSGGAMAIFTDPHAETAAPARPGMPGPETRSDLQPLFSAWGIRHDATRAVADPLHQLSTTRRGADLPNPVWMRLTPETMERSSPLLGQLNSLVLTTAGSFAAEEGTRFTPLVTASEQAVLVPAAEAGSPYADARKLLAEAAPSEAAPVLALRLEGALKTAFPDGKPEGSDWAAQHLSEGQSANITLVADADMLMDRNWIQRQNFLGAQIPQAFADNGDFLLNLAEQMAGGAALADLRGRATDWRGLERIEVMQSVAEARYRATEQALLERISQAETSLRELAKSGPAEGAVLNDQLAAESERLRADLLAARAELRQVRHDLRAEVETLQSRLTALNVGLVPILAAVGALLIALRKPRRQVPTRLAV